MRKSFAIAAGFTLLSVALCCAEEFRAVITKVDGNKVVFHKVTRGDNKKAEKGEAMTLSVAANVKVIKGKFNQETKKAEDGEPLENGLKNEAFSKEANVTITTNEGNTEITKIRLSGRGRTKKGTQ